MSNLEYGSGSSHEPPRSLLDLPAELLAKIIGRSIREERRSIQRLYRLRTVCRLWNDTIRYFPRLWSRILVDDLQYLSISREILKNSREAPLHITQTAFLSTFEDRMLSSHILFDELLAHIGRCKTLDIKVSHTFTLLDRLACAAPQLKVATIWYEYVGATIPIVLFGGRAPKLTHLNIRGFLVCPKLDFLRHLKVLTICPVRSRDGKTEVNGFVEILRSCHVLRSLKIECHESWDEPSAEEIPSSVQMPSLHSIEFSDRTNQGDRGLASIVRSIRAPNCRRFVHFSNDISDPKVLQQLLSTAVVNSMHDTGVALEVGLERRLLSIKLIVQRDRRRDARIGISIERENAASMLMEMLECIKDIKVKFPVEASIMTTVKDRNAFVEFLLDAKEPFGTLRKVEVATSKYKHHQEPPSNSRVKSWTKTRFHNWNIERRPWSTTLTRSLESQTPTPTVSTPECGN